MRHFETKTTLVALTSLAVVIGLASLAFSQGVAAHGPKISKATLAHGPMHFETHIGSFKILERNPKQEPEGTLTLSFTGTVLISNLIGKLESSGNLRREYYDDKHKKQVWFGTGTLKLEGQFHNLQWFGRNMKADFMGNGIFRLYGEFDKDLNTGYYWFDKPEDKNYWGTSGSSLQVPHVDTGPMAHAVPRPEPSKRKGG
jgi:hypothetical protein